MKPIFESQAKALAYTDNTKKALVKFTEGDSYNLILLAVNGKAVENFQTNISLSRDVYVTTFGQGLSPFQLTGLFIDNICSSSKTDLKGFYSKYKVSNHATLTVTFAGMTIKGFLTDVDISPYSASGLSTFKYTLSILGQVIL